MSDKKAELSDDDIVFIECHSKTFKTTYRTISRIPYLKAQYERWDHDKTKPLFIDAPAELIEKLLAKYTIITEDYLTVGCTYIDLRGENKNYDPSGLTIIIGLNIIQFKYMDKTQTWFQHFDKKNRDSPHYYRFEEYEIAFQSTKKEYLETIFFDHLVADFIFEKPIVDKKPIEIINGWGIKPIEK
jgi:hypothetical protein